MNVVILVFNMKFYLKLKYFKERLTFNKFLHSPNLYSNRSGPDGYNNLFPLPYVVDNILQSSLNFCFTRFYLFGLIFFRDTKFLSMRDR